MFRYIEMAEALDGKGSTRKEVRVWPRFQMKTTPMLPAGEFEGKVAFITGGGVYAHFHDEYRPDVRLRSMCATESHA